jgi:hypothetical protein
MLPTQIIIPREKLIYPLAEPAEDTRRRTASSRIPPRVVNEDRSLTHGLEESDAVRIVPVQEPGKEDKHQSQVRNPEPPREELEVHALPEIRLKTKNKWKAQSITAHPGPLAIPKT